MCFFNWVASCDHSAQGYLLPSCIEARCLVRELLSEKFLSQKSHLLGTLRCLTLLWCLAPPTEVEICSQRLHLIILTFSCLISHGTKGKDTFSSVFLYILFSFLLFFCVSFGYHFPFSDLSLLYCRSLLFQNLEQLTPDHLALHWLLMSSPHTS